MGDQPTTFARGSTANRRAEGAALRAVHGHMAVRYAAEAICDRLDEVTQTAVPIVELHDEDSLVIALDDAITKNQP